MSEKVFCDKCKYIKKADERTNEYVMYDCLCTSPNNKEIKMKHKDTYLTEGKIYYEKIRSCNKNKNNDCNWYEQK